MLGELTSHTSFSPRAYVCGCAPAFSRSPNLRRGCAAGQQHLLRLRHGRPQFTRLRCSTGRRHAAVGNPQSLPTLLATPHFFITAWLSEPRQPSASSVARAAAGVAGRGACTRRASTGSMLGELQPPVPAPKTIRHASP